MTKTTNNEYEKNQGRKVLNVPNKREQNQTRLDSAEREGLRPKGNVPILRFPGFQGEWEKCKLCDVSTIVGRIGFRGYTTQDIVEEGKGAIALSPTNIVNNKLTYEKDNTYISFHKYEESPEIMINQGDVIFVKTGSTVGKVAYVGELIGKTTLNPQVVVLKNILCDNYILSVIMSTQKFQSKIRKITVGGAVPTLSQVAMGNISISLPKVEEQIKLSKFIALLDERIATQSKVIDKLQSLIRGIRCATFSHIRKTAGTTKTIGEILQYEQPQNYIVTDTEYSSYGIPVLTANKAFILGYTNENYGIYDKGDCVIFDDFTLDCKYVNFPFKVKSSAIKILTSKNRLLLRYAYEYLKYLCLSTDEHKRHYIAETQYLPIPLKEHYTTEKIASMFEILSTRIDIAYKIKKGYEEQKQYLLCEMFI